MALARREILVHTFYKSEDFLRFHRLLLYIPLDELGRCLHVSLKCPSGPRTGFSGVIWQSTRLGDFTDRLVRVSASYTEGVGPPRG